jgi:V/A-type H+-transporting ATPase subunit E
MNAEQVVEKILSQARAEAKTILDEAQAKADAQKARLQSELAEFDRQSDAMAAAAAEDKLQRILAGARMTNARQLLAAKIEQLDDVFRKAENRVIKMSDDAYKGLMVELMKKAVETGDEEVIVGKEERRIDDELIKQVNRQLGAGFKGNLRLSSKRVDIKGGFILARGKVQMNSSVEVIIGQLREEMETKLAAKLFAE